MINRLLLNVQFYPSIYLYIFYKKKKIINILFNFLIIYLLHTSSIYIYIYKQNNIIDSIFLVQLELALILEDFLEEL